MTPRSRTILTLVAGTLLGLTLFAALGSAQGQARWHRYEQSKLDDYTTIDTLKDVYSQRCYAVYVHTPPHGAVTTGAGPTAIAVQTITVVAATTSLGEVPCLPTK